MDTLIATRAHIPKTGTMYHAVDLLRVADWDEEGAPPVGSILGPEWVTRRSVCRQISGACYVGVRDVEKFVRSFRDWDDALESGRSVCPRCVATMKRRAA